MAAVIISREAEADLEVILLDLVERAGSLIAARYVEGILATLESLAVVPEASGRPVPQLGLDLRCHPMGTYNAYLRYDKMSDVLSIVRVLHGRRKMTRKLFRLRQEP